MRLVHQLSVEHSIQIWKFNNPHHKYIYHNTVDVLLLTVIRKTYMICKYNKVQLTGKALGWP